MLLEWRREQRERKIALGIIISELKMIENHLRRVYSLIDGIEPTTGKSLSGGRYYGLIVPRNSWTRYRHLLVTILNEDQVEIIEKAYSLEEFDRRMEFAISAAAMGSPLECEARGLYWFPLEQSRGTADEMTGLIDALSKMV